MTRRCRLAYFSPLPPARTGVADYSRELLPELARRAEIALFTDDPQAVAKASLPSLPLFSIDDYPAQRWEFDAALYHMGNSVYHEAIYESALRYPGIVVLHDFGLHHFIFAHTVGRGSWAAYAREMSYACGAAGVAQARAVQRGQTEAPVWEWPLNDRLLDRSLGVIVHSQWSRQQIIARRPQTPVTVAPAPIVHYPGEIIPRSALGWPEEAVVFASLGQVTAAKQVDVALRAFARLRAQIPQARFLIVGEQPSPEVDLEAIIGALDLADSVHFVGFVDDLADFTRWIAVADVVVNLRNPTVGETSATALRALAAGRPLIVWDHGWYAELPDDVCLKAPPGDEEGLLAAMLALADDAERRQAMGQRAAEHAARVHTPARTVDAYLQAVHSALTRMGNPSSPRD